MENRPPLLNKLKPASRVHAIAKRRCGNPADANLLTAPPTAIFDEDDRLRFPLLDFSWLPHNIDGKIGRLLRAMILVGHP
ncbi:hypothetical protein AVEN_229634-1 [Araneus ventricosus]|uniref:Uncharacterized protein n=1 Tax=Araneus ventricosus TaxID=182803 RepID=A0A4Y2HUN8_ARAVE|nr:hypothetical protein AVEN_229634-1 [Araneus ventricosus]